MAKNYFVVEKKPFLSVLSAMQPICTKRTTLDATTTILFNVDRKELVLKGTDLEISLQTSQEPQEIVMENAQSFLLAGRRLFDIVKELDDTITFYVEDNQVRLQSGSVDLALHIKDAQEFPPFPERIENLMQIDAKFLLELLNKVAFIIPQNHANQSLNGLYWEVDENGMKMTATDGHCLVQVTSDKYSLKEAKSWLLPRRAILELKKILENAQDAVVFVGTCDGQLVVSGTSFNFFTKLLVNKFPEYQSVLERKSFMPARIDRTQFVRTLRRSACLLSGQFLATDFTFKPDALHVSIQNKDVGKLQEDIALDAFKGNEIALRFYAPYLLNGMNAFSDDKVTLHLHSSAKPIMFDVKKDDYALLYLVMPVAASHG